MKNDKLSFLLKYFSSYEIRFTEDGDFAEIINPFYTENVKVEYIADDDFNPFIVYFAFQHCHMCDEEDIVEYINEIVNENKFSIEFFKNGKRRFGSDITAQELERLSYEKLEQHTGYWGITKLKQMADAFKVRGWNPNRNFDAVFVINNGESVTIQKIG